MSPHQTPAFIALGLVTLTIMSCATTTAPVPATPQSAGSTAVTGCLDQDYAPTPAGAKLDVPARPPVCRAWNGAANLTMLAGFYGWEMSECQLMTAKTGDRCCLMGCEYGSCGSLMDGDDISSTLSGILHIQTSHTPSPLQETTLQTELSSGRPVLIGFDGPYEGHFALVSGFTPGDPPRYVMHDPTPGMGGASKRSYAELLYDRETGAHWTQTWHRAQPPQEYCRKRAMRVIAPAAH